MLVLVLVALARDPMPHPAFAWALAGASVIWALVTSFDQVGGQGSDPTWVTAGDAILASYALLAPAAAGSTDFFYGGFPGIAVVIAAVRGRRWGWSVAGLLSFYCPLEGRAVRDAHGALRLGMVVGRATRPDGSPLPAGSRLVAEWPSDERLGQATASRTEQRALDLPADGRFRLRCVPVGRALQLRVEVEGRPGEPTELIIPALGLGQIDLVGAREP